MFVKPEEKACVGGIQGGRSVVTEHRALVRRMARKSESGGLSAMRNLTQVLWKKLTADRLSVICASQPSFGREIHFPYIHISKCDFEQMK